MLCTSIGVRILIFVYITASYRSIVPESVNQHTSKYQKRSKRFVCG